MFDTKLPATNTQAPGAIQDAASCERWLSQLQLTDVRAAHAVVSRELELLNRYALPAPERLKILELLRETVAFLQEQYAQRLAGRKLPFDEAELAAFTAVIGLWQAMATGYRRCLEADELAPVRPLLCQRCLRYTGERILEHLRSCYECPPALWRDLHACYAYAEAQALADVPVADAPAKGAAASSCKTLYVELLLTCHANPFELSRKQLELVRRWLAGWSAAVAVGPAPPQGEEKVPVLAVYLKGDSGLQNVVSVTVSEATRYLDLSGLSKLLRVKMVLLDQGYTPEQLDLGKDCVQPSCRALLAHLHRIWCEGGTPRMFERRASQAEAEVCFGIPAIHFHASGGAFRQPKKKDLSQQQRHEIEALGHVVSDTGKLTATDLGFALETWQVKDESVLGMRLKREGGGERLSVNQIAGARLVGADWFMVGVIRWLLVTREGYLQAGLRILPGTPKPVALRATGVNLTVSGKYVQALLMPEIPALSIPSSLVMPLGWFQPQRVVELFYDGAERNVRLALLVERGVDYERASFTSA